MQNTQKTPLSLGAIILLGTLTAIGPMSIDMYLPSFPSIQQSFNTEAGMVQWTLASFFIGLALGQLFYGPISDRFGRKPPLYFGMLLYAAASAGCMLAPNIETLIACRFLQALGGCTGMVICRAIVRDRCEPQAAAKIFSMLMLVMGLAPILAPLLGGWLAVHASWRVLFGILVVFGLVCVTGLHFGLTETVDRHKAAPLHLGNVLQGYGLLLRDRWFLGYTLCSGLASAGMFAYITGSPFVLINLHGIPAEHFGWVFGSNAFGLILASQLNTRFLKTNDIDTLLRRALWSPFLAGLLLLVTAWLHIDALYVLLPCLFFFVAAIGFIGPNASAAALKHHGSRAGLASALMGSLQFTLATLVGFLMGAWQDPSARPLATLMCVCGVCAWLVHRTLVMRNNISQS
ncbi:DHA1 family bicyclomycin/chloramphenicol resistance-like MFS transporter [Silvimonas terrae]|uniref:Bcr/CflA family efflux transporter n=1 Tax=Silvimonas terrae TaxID=300266 RepID=A0A840R938_9NEIS|nr:Bcr/CflA family multidrug efflux MFS transporter [Silvimonas terrae]MBB5189879.1 DHA1 family bicyclomycin/chloramphenicol resistance-like MFS transporter [Silvimonas terrae]